MRIRKAKKEDFEYYKKLEQEFYNHHRKYNTLFQDVNPKKRNLKKEFLEILKDKNSFFRFAVLDGKIVGYIYAIVKKVGENEKGWNKIIDFNSIVVFKNYRHRKIGSALVKELFKWAKSKKISYISASANIKNKEIILFNKKMGFIEQHIKFGKILK